MRRWVNKQTNYKWLVEQVETRDRSECWIWPFGTNGLGYGKVKLEDRRTEYVHVLALSMEEPRPEGMECRHTCPGGSNSLCFNPDHLVWGTHEENMQDRFAEGYKQWNRAFTVEQVRSIRTMLASGMKAQSIADTIGCSIWPIYDIKRGRTYTDIE